MILSDREIRAAKTRGAVRITPEPEPAAWSSTAVDLRLAGPLLYWHVPGGDRAKVVFCPHDPAYDFAALTAEYGREVPLGEQGHIVEPFSFLLGWTVERIQLPHASRLAARVEGKSSLARLGLGVHVTAPTIHAGFGATGDPDYPGSAIRLEMWNIGPLRIKLEMGMPVCQLVFEWVDGTPEQGYRGQFTVQGPDSATSRPTTSEPARRKRRRH
jgi:dCTP deaminase